MHLRSFRSLTTFTVTSAALLGLAADAGAQGAKDKEAMKLHDQAMNDDYLNVAFDKSEKKLKDALKRCGANACSKEVLGKLHVALGTVHGVGLNDLKQAEDDFVTALKADPNAKPDPSLTNPDLDKAFAAAQKKAGVAGAGPGKPGKPDPAEPGEGPKGAGGDIEHTPIPEQAINTPVPVYIEIPEELGVSTVTLRYKPFGAPKWKSLEMQKVGNGFGAEIPCEDVTTTGDIRYYVIAKDAEGNPAGTAGSLKEPHKVPIKNDIEGDSPSLPGKKPPSKCAAKEDCPPGLPGCPDAGAKRGDKGWGASCEETQECQSGLVCLNGSCEEGAEGAAKKSDGKGPKNIITVGAQLDLLLISGADDVCSGSDSAYTCFYSDDSGQFYGAPKQAPGTNGIQGGFGLGSVRPLIGYDRVLLNLGPGSLAAGLRLGFAFGGSPSSDDSPPSSGTVRDGLANVPEDDRPDYNQSQANSYMPFHGELRATFVFGPSPLEQSKVRPYIFLGGGLAQVNASVPVTVCDHMEKNYDPVTAADNDEDPCGEVDDGPARAVSVDAYQITGLNFVGIGGGVVYGITSNIGIGAELKVMFMLPTFGIVFAPTIGPVFGF